MLFLFNIFISFLTLILCYRFFEGIPILRNVGLILCPFQFIIHLSSLMLQEKPRDTKK